MYLPRTAIGAPAVSAIRVYAEPAKSSTSQSVLSRYRFFALTTLAPHRNAPGRVAMTATRQVEGLAITHSEKNMKAIVNQIRDMH